MNSDQFYYKGRSEEWLLGASCSLTGYKSLGPGEKRK